MFISSRRHHELVMKFEKHKADVKLDTLQSSTAYNKLSDEYDELRTKLTEEFDLKEKQVVAACEDKMAKAITALKEKHMEDKTKFMEKGLEENYSKLSKSLTKLHEEGNAQTKFVQDLSLKMADSFSPASYTRITHTDK